MLVAARLRASVRLFASLALPLCLSAVAHPQTPTPPSSSDGLSFEQLYELAARDNLQINAVRRRRAVAEAEIQIAGQRPNPDFISAYTRAVPRWQPSMSQLIELGGKRG